MWEEKPLAASGKSYLFFKPASARWNPDEVDRFVEMIKTDYADLVDPNRIYLTGFSMRLGDGKVIDWLFSQKRGGVTE